MKEKLDEILVSVVMSVYNTNEIYLREAIESILAQTHTNIEFIIIDDKSDPWCRRIIESYTDKRILVLRNKENIGLTASLNKGLKQATGKYIARMDSDDISYKDRIAKQLIFMEENSSIDISATIAAIVQNGKIVQYSGLYHKFDLEKIRIQMSFANVPFVHPTVIFRKIFLEHYNLYYDETIKKAQDYNMWVRCLEYGKIDVLQCVLLDYRVHTQQISNESQLQRKDAERTKLLCLQKIIADYSDSEKELYLHWKDIELYGSPEENIAFMKKMILLNDKINLYHKDKYKNEILFWWFRKAFFKENKKHRIEMLNDHYIKREILISFKHEIVSYILQKKYEKKFRKML